LSNHLLFLILVVVQPSDDVIIITKVVRRLLYYSIPLLVESSFVLIIHGRNHVIPRDVGWLGKAFFVHTVRHGPQR